MIFSKASGINDSIFGKSQEPIRMMLEQQEEAFMKASMIDKVFMMDTTTNFGEKYTMETSMADFEPVGENGAYPETEYQEGYSKVIEPDTWKSSFKATQEMVEDAKMGKIKQEGNKFMLSFGRTREKFGADLLNNGQATSFTFGKKAKSFDISGADGLALFSTAHTSITNGYTDQANYFGNDFSYDALGLVEEAMQNFRDDNGELLNVQPDTIIIPNKKRVKDLVFDAIGAEGQPGTANNSFSQQFGRWNVIIWPYLSNTSGITSGTDSWFMLDSQYNKAYGGLVWLERIALSVKSYIDEGNDANVFKGRARYGAAPNNWRAICKVDPGLGTVLTV